MDVKTEISLMVGAFLAGAGAGFSVASRKWEEKFREGTDYLRSIDPVDLAVGKEVRDLANDVTLKMRCLPAGYTIRKYGSFRHGDGPELQITIEGNSGDCPEGVEVERVR